MSIVKLYNIVEKDGETRFIISKEGVFFSLNYDDIQELESIFEEIYTRIDELKKEISEVRSSYDRRRL